MPPSPRYAAFAIVAACAAAQSSAAPGDPPTRTVPGAPQAGQQQPASAADRQPAPARGAQADQAREAAALMQRSGGSLMRATMAQPADPSRPALAQVSFFAVPEPEPRTIKKHDLVTVIVREESAFSSKGTSDVSREAAIDARLEEFIQLKIKNLEIEGGAIGATPPSIKGNTSRTFKGEGTVDRADSLTARITGEVLDVKPNGTLVVQARKQIRTDDEEQTFILTGICRAEDVNADNTILSTQMFDLQLQKNHKGAVYDATRRGWFLKMLDAIAPF